MTETLHDLLSLVVKEEFMPTIKQVKTWSANMYREAEKWAAAEYLAASNNDVNRLQEPDFFRHYKRKL